MNNKETAHNSVAKVGILLVNLGTPDNYDTSCVRRYLREFLSDTRVVNLPKILWWFVLNLVIVPFRAKKSSKAYKSIWTKAGSPLLVIANSQTAAIKTFVQEHSDKNIVVELAMRYGNPSIAKSLAKFSQQNVKSLVVLPLYPQYSATTTASTFDKIATIFSKYRYLPDYRFINHYHDDKRYIAALVASIVSFRQKYGSADKLLMSFHSLPEAHLKAGDPYYCECCKTARLIAEKLQLKEDDYQVSFQSRLGSTPWLKPYTDTTLVGLAKSGVKSIQVICPGFSADCLETLEEIAIYNKELFLTNGGSSYQYIPCLNDNKEHIEFLGNLLIDNIANFNLDENTRCKH